MIARLGEPLRFVELEGDAVFAYVPAAAFAEAERLLDTQRPLSRATSPGNSASDVSVYSGFTGSASG